MTYDDTGSVSPFASDRERRLWLWTLALVVGICSTLGLARAWAGALDDRVFGVGFFLLGALLVLAAVVTHGLTTRPSGVEIAVALGVAAVYLMVLQRMAIPLERSHLFEYSVVAVFILEPLRERASHGRRVPVPGLLAIVAASLVGILDEGIQLFHPSRVFDPIDIVFDTMAAGMAVAASVALTWARRKACSSSRSLPSSPSRPADSSKKPQKRAT